MLRRKIKKGRDMGGAGVLKNEKVYIDHDKNVCFYPI